MIEVVITGEPSKEYFGDDTYVFLHGDCLSSPGKFVRLARATIKEMEHVTFIRKPSKEYVTFADTEDLVRIIEELKRRPDWKRIVIITTSPERFKLNGSKGLMKYKQFAGTNGSDIVLFVSKNYALVYDFTCIYGFSIRLEKRRFLHFNIEDALMKYMVGLVW